MPRTCSWVATEWNAGSSATAASSLQQCLHRAGLGVHQNTRDEVGEDPYAVDRADLDVGCGDQLGELLGGEPAGHRVACAPAARRVA